MRSPALAATNALHLYQSLAASVPPTLDDCLAWVGVYPLDPARQETQEFLLSRNEAPPLPSTRLYHVRRFEVERSLIESDVWLAEPDLRNKTSLIAYGDDDLVRVLDRWGVQLDELALPSRSDYPI